LAAAPPKKLKWKVTVKKAIYSHWEDKLKKEATEQTSLQFLNLDACALGQVHQIWRCGADPLQTSMAMVKARLLVQRYALAGTHCAGKHRSTKCPLCDGPQEDIRHFILQCPLLDKARETCVSKFRKISTEFFLQPRSDQDILQAILDSSVFTWFPQEAQEEMEKLTRRLVFQLHNARSVQMGYDSRFARAVKCSSRR
jgi:hypothetical protein